MYFYVKSIDTFIELNGYWTHGDHFYDENSKEDQDKLEEWRKRSLYCEFYSKAIEVWTISDLNKKKVAEENDINYLVFWNLKDVEEWIRRENEQLN